jgi:pyruvoyl-dependent arginine decarboxylase (PvlArgDC)
MIAEIVAEVEGNEQCNRGRVVELEVSYGGSDGPDLIAVATQVGLSAEEVIARHSAAEYRVERPAFLDADPKTWSEEQFKEAKEFETRQKSAREEMAKKLQTIETELKTLKVRGAQASSGIRSERGRARRLSRVAERAASTLSLGHRV